MPGHQLTERTPPTEASICVGCGLCCDGTVLTHLAVSDQSDVGAPLAALGVELHVAADPPVFALPCPAVEHGACTVFELHRPRACSHFECDLSRAVAAGDLDPQQARATIAETIELRDRVAAGAAEPDELRRRVRRHFRSG